MAVGPVLGADGTTPEDGRQGKTGETIVGQAHGKYYESASRGLIYSAGSAVAVTVQVSITTTATFTLHNPANSKKRIELLKVAIAYFSGTLGGGAWMHGKLDPGKTLPSSGTALTAYCTNVGNLGAAAAVGVARTGATVVAGEVLYPFATSNKILATSAVAPPTRCIEDVDGLIVLEPGAQYQLLGVFGDAGSSPAVTIGAVWSEVDIV